MCGFGKKTFVADGTICEGLWKDDKLNGTGTITWPNKGGKDHPNPPFPSFFDFNLSHQLHRKVPR